MLRARSVAEARLYMDRQPCAGCGALGFDADAELVAHGDDLASVYRGYCPTCGKRRQFEFLLPEAFVPPGRLGGPEPSTLIDAGEFLALADGLSRQVPASPTGLDAAARQRAAADLGRAIAALEEVLKFIPASASRPARAAFFTSQGRRAYLAEPARFDRERLEAVRDAWRALARELGSGDTPGS